jgi:hypothetical protein
MENHFTSSCSKQFKADNQTAAQMSDSAEDSEVQCHFCCQNFSNWTQMYIHTRKYHLDSSFSLETLSQKNSGILHFEFDTLIETKKSLVRCQKCHKDCLATFTRKKTLQIEKKKSKKIAIIPKKHSCQFCDSIFECQVNLVGHYRLKHQDWVKNIWITCPRCKNHFSDHAAIDKHEDTCLKANYNYPKSKHYLCNFCNEQIGSRLMYSHVRTVHPKEVQTSWIKCYKCDLRFPDFNAMVQHFLKKCSQHMKTRHNVENQTTRASPIVTKSSFMLGMYIPKWSVIFYLVKQVTLTIRKLPRNPKNLRWTCQLRSPMGVNVSFVTRASPIVSKCTFMLGMYILKWLVSFYLVKQVTLSITATIANCHSQQKKICSNMLE